MQMYGLLHKHFKEENTSASIRFSGVLQFKYVI